jgi:hypothetical protein
MAFEFGDRIPAEIRLTSWIWDDRMFMNFESGGIVACFSVSSCFSSVRTDENRENRETSQATAMVLQTNANSWTCLWVILLTFHPQDGGPVVLRNVGILPHHNPEDWDFDLTLRCEAQDVEEVSGKREDKQGWGEEKERKRKRSRKENEKKN